MPEHFSAFCAVQEEPSHETMNMHSQSCEGSEDVGGNDKEVETPYPHLKQIHINQGFFDRNTQAQQAGRGTLSASDTPRNRIESVGDVHGRDPGITVFDQDNKKSFITRVLD